MPYHWVTHMADIDPATIITTGLSAATAWSGRKLLGPLFDEMAQDLRQRYAERRARNLEAILDAGARRLGSELEKPGTVPPRLLGLLLDEASWCEDEVLSEYWGGVLAASRTPDGRDDRGITWAKAISRLSRFQVRAHYLLYTAMRHAALSAPPFDIGQVALLEEMTSVYVPMSAFAAALDLRPDEIRAVGAHTVIGLVNEGLLDSTFWAYGPKEDLEGCTLTVVPEDGIVVAASYSGMELYYWAHGYSNFTEYEFTSPEIDFEPGVAVPGFRDVSAVHALRAARSAQGPEPTSPEP